MVQTHSLCLLKYERKGMQFEIVRRKNSTVGFNEYGTFQHQSCISSRTTCTLHSAQFSPHSLTVMTLVSIIRRPKLGRGRIHMTRKSALVSFRNSLWSQQRPLCRVGQCPYAYFCESIWESQKNMS